MTRSFDKAQDFRQIVSPLGKVVWSSVFKSKRDLSDRPIWDIAIELTAEEVMDGLDMQIEALLAFKRKEDPKFPKTNAGFTYPYGPSRSRDEDGNLSGEKEGVFLLKAKRRCQYTDKRGDIQDQRPVTIVDSFGEPFKLTDEIPGGSIVRISYDLFAFSKGGNAGVSAGLQGVQIKSLGAGGGGSMFGTLDTEGEDIAD